MELLDSNSNSNGNIRRRIAWIGFMLSLSVFAFSSVKHSSLSSPLSSSPLSVTAPINAFNDNGNDNGNIQEEEQQHRRLQSMLDPKTVEYKSHPQEQQAPLPPPLNNNSMDDIVLGDTTKPSYVQLCEAIIDRHTNMEARNKLLVVHESPAVCQTQESYAAMTAIMTSALIAHAGTQYRLSYQHNCESTATGMPLQEKSLQQILPPDLPFGIGVTAQAMVDKCQKCLPTHESRHLAQLLDCSMLHQYLIIRT